MEINNLKSYLANINMKMGEFCELIGCSRPYLSRLVHGRVTPGKRIAKDIYEMTDKVVDIRHLVREKKK